MPGRPDRSRPTVDVLRLGHRAGRDPRLTTHLALVARAFGARGMWLHPPDAGVARSLAGVTERWGGHFEVIGCPDWRRAVKGFDGETVHLTMYGEPLDATLPKLRRARHLLTIVGGAKVPSELYRLATFNVAVGHQPHSEVAALALFLDRMLGLPGPQALPGARQVIVPSARGKRVERREAA